MAHFFGSKVSPKKANELFESYDFIVIGAGSAGCVVAARLSEDPNINVLLLEAGGNDTGVLEIAMPAAVGTVIYTEHDWKYYTEPQEHACNYFEDEENFWPRGKVLGGCSSLNYMAYVRGCNHDFDTWEKMGATGWGSKDVFKYFVKSEDCLIDKDRVDEKVHGYGGPLSVEAPAEKNNVCNVFVDAWKHAGYDEIDYNDQTFVEGCAHMQMNTRKGARCSTSVGFLQAAKDRKNLHVLVYAHVTKIIIEEENGKKFARGVECRVGAEKKNHINITLAASKEVICSGGAVNSPQILLLSGVGPKAELAEVGIECVHDLDGVGKNMEDHFLIPLNYHAGLQGYDINKQDFVNPLTKKENKELRSYLQANKDNLKFWNIGAICKASAESLGTVYNWFVNGIGMLSSSGFNAHAFIRSGISPFEGPDIQIGLFCGLLPWERLKETGRSRQQIYDQFPECQAKDADVTNNQGFMITMILLHPESKGFVKLRNSDPFSPPIIDPKYLSHPQDMATAKEGLRRSHKTMKNYKPFSKITAYLGFPESLREIYDENVDWVEQDDVLEDYIRGWCTTVYHPACTCKIGEVVDAELVVKGIENLRVIDASIMPMVTSGNTNAPVIMIGEKGAAMIATKHKLNQTLATVAPPPASSLPGIIAISIAIGIVAVLWTCYNRSAFDSA